MAVTRRSFRQYDEDIGFAGIMAPTVRQAGSTLTTQALVAQRLFLVRFRPTRNMAITVLSFEVTTGDTVDNAVHVGLYDATGARLATSGAVTGKVNAARVSVVSLGSTVNLLAGTVYGAAILAPTITTSLTLRSVNYAGSGSAVGILTATDGGSIPKFPSTYFCFLNTQTTLPATITLNSLSADTGGPLLGVREA